MLPQPLRRIEEILAGNGKEFGRGFGGVGIDRRFEVCVELVVEALEGLAESLAPSFCVHALVKWREAVHVAVELVDLVGEFVDDDVEACSLTGMLDVFERDDHRSVSPGLAGAQVSSPVHHAGLVNLLTVSDESGRIHDECMKPPIPCDAQFQYGQRGEHGHGQVFFRGRFEATGAVEVLGREDFGGAFVEPVALGGFDLVKDVEETRHPLEQGRVGRVALQHAPPEELSQSREHGNRIRDVGSLQAGPAGAKSKTDQRHSDPALSCRHE